MIEFTNEVKVELVSSNAEDDMVARAAWVSHGEVDEERLDDRDRVEGLINFLWRERHTSPFEHGQFVFRVSVPLFVAREWHRHRTQSYNEISGRYTVMSPLFYRGDSIRVQKGKPGNYYFEEGSDEQFAVYIKSKERVVSVAWEEYQKRLDAGISKEQAREDLPLSLMTHFYATINPLNLMKFLSLRNDPHALKEIRDAAEQTEEIFAQKMPLTYEAYLKNKETE